LTGSQDTRAEHLLLCLVQTTARRTAEFEKLQRTVGELQQGQQPLPLRSGANPSQQPQAVEAEPGPPSDRATEPPSARRVKGLSGRAAAKRILLATDIFARDKEEQQATVDAVLPWLLDEDVTSLLPIDSTGALTDSISPTAWVKITALASVQAASKKRRRRRSASPSSSSTDSEVIEALPDRPSSARKAKDVYLGPSGGSRTPTAVGKKQASTLFGGIERRFVYDLEAAPSEENLLSSWFAQVPDLRLYAHTKSMTTILATVSPSDFACPAVVQDFLRYGKWSTLLSFAGPSPVNKQFLSASDVLNCVTNLINLVKSVFGRDCPILRALEEVDDSRKINALLRQATVALEGVGWPKEGPLTLRRAASWLVELIDMAWKGWESSMFTRLQASFKEQLYGEVRWIQGKITSNVSVVGIREPPRRRLEDMVPGISFMAPSGYDSAAKGHKPPQGKAGTGTTASASPAGAARAAKVKTGDTVEGRPEPGSPIELPPGSSWPAELATLQASPPSAISLLFGKPDITDPRRYRTDGKTWCLYQIVYKKKCALQSCRRLHLDWTADKVTVAKPGTSPPTSN